MAACTFSLAGAAQADDGFTLIQFMPAGEFGPSDGCAMGMPAWRIDVKSARSVIAQHAARRTPQSGRHRLRAPDPA